MRIKNVKGMSEEFVKDLASKNKVVLFVGTKRQSKDIVKQLAEDTNMPYVCERWLGGLLTNQKTIGGRIKHLKDLESRMESGALAAKYNKLEVQRYQEEIDRMSDRGARRRSTVVCNPYLEHI